MSDGGRVTVAHAPVSAVVEIDAVIPTAQRMPAWALVPGDSIYDTLGTPHRIVWLDVRRVRGSDQPLLWIKRDDQHFNEPFVFLDEEVTILPSLRARETQEV
jgi:hypothetical protein